MASLNSESGTRNNVGASNRRTEVLRNSEDIAEVLKRLFTNETALVSICTATLKPNQPQEAAGITEAYLNLAKNGGTIRLLTKITKENITYCKALMKAVEIRHLSGISSNFAVSSSEYLETPGTSGFSPSGPWLYSNEDAFVRHHETLFESLWENAIPAPERIKEIEEGFVAPEIGPQHNPLQVQSLYAELVTQARGEIMLLLPSAGAFHRDEKIGIIDLLRAAAERGVKVSVLGPIDPLIQKVLPGFEAERTKNGTSNPISYRVTSETTSRNTTKLLVTDRSASLVIEVRDPSKPDFVDAIGGATYTTIDPTVRADIHFFERVRDEIDLRIKEERSRRDAELMQDILAHDIRNYNQVIKLNGEVLQEKLEDRELRGFVGSILHAADGSSNLIQKAKTLSKLMSQDKVPLHGVDLGQSLENALSLVRQANPARVMETIPRLPAATVLADELLDEAFVNILSNAVEYTEGTKVPIDLRLEEGEGPHGNGGKADYWKVSITDQGRGIPDERKQLISRRHLDSAKGSGLGLSIVRALVVDRYSGRLELKNRIEGDYKKGTSVEIWLPKA